MERKYISTVETAKLIRVQLAKKFPAVKFSVKSRSYSMGSSIDIHWTDGPTAKDVDAVVQGFCGGGFDGMIDLKYSIESWLLPDGSAIHAKTAGTSGSVPAFETEKPCEGAVMVDFGPDHIFCNRSYSERAMLKAVLTVHDKYGLPLLNVKMTPYGPEFEGDLYAKLDPRDTFTNRDRVHQELRELSL